MSSSGALGESAMVGIRKDWWVVDLYRLAITCGARSGRGSRVGVHGASGG